MFRLHSENISGSNCYSAQSFTALTATKVTHGDRKRAESKFAVSGVYLGLDIL